jgi:hypothetical protein
MWIREENKKESSHKRQKQKEKEAHIKEKEKLRGTTFDYPNRDKS